ncbi:MAG TPA: PKD domain-containing protein [Chitinophagales bacterium]|nr:PKD domain-containing protein [Chitinophagales bacterium]
MKSFYILVCICFLYLCCIINVAAQPVASFLINAPIPACQPAVVSFSNASTGGGALTYQWQFGIDGATDTATNTSYSYDTCGIFSVVLSVTDGDGQTTSDTQQVVINCTPVAFFSFTPVTVCDSSNVLFADSSTPADSIATWLWDFGDPLSGISNTSSLQNPSHFYHQPGDFIISLAVTSNAGCTATAKDTFSIYHPQSSFALQDTACANDSTQFNDLSVSEDSIVSWFWTFDDPSSGSNVSIKQNPFHIYKEAGDYDVRLTITTENGCTGLLKKTIHVYGLPDVNAGTDLTICSLDSVQLQASGALTYLWQPSSLLSNAAIPDPFAFPPGSQDFMVAGTDTNGCSAMDTVHITVLPLPAADAGNDTTICTGNSTVLQGSGGISYQWSPATGLDNDTLSQPTATPSFTTAYTVTVEDASGCSASDSVTVHVAPVPVVTITGLSDAYCSNAVPVVLTAVPSGGVFSGDGVSDDLFDPSSLVAGGPYSIIYSYTDPGGCSANDTAGITILSPPEVFISTGDSTLCLNAPPVSFVLIPVGGILSGDGISGTFFDPALAGSGIHPVYYSVTDSNNCSATDTLQINVFALPAVSAGDDTLICNGDSVQLHATGGLNYSWSPGNTLSDSMISDPVAFPLITTTYAVTATDANQCSNTDSILITLFSLLNVDAGVDDTICSGDTLLLSATGGNDYSWMPAEGLSDSSIANPLAFPQVTTVYTVTVNAGSTCPGKDSVLITVNTKPGIIASADTFLCEGDSVQLFVSGAVTYLWEPSNSLDDNQADDPMAFPEATTNYTVTGTDLNGCSESAEIAIAVILLPSIDAGPDTSICSGDTVQLIASGGTSYSWIPESFLSDNNISNPHAFPDTTTSFIVTGTGDSGCANTDTVKVFVLSPGVIDAGADTAICKGDSILLQATGGLGYSWSPADGLSDPFIANPIAFPETTTVYTVTAGVGTDCFFSDTLVIQVNELPGVIAGNDSSICPGDSLQLEANGAVTYLWSPGNSLNDPAISNPFASPLITTAYSVTGTDVQGCKNTDTVVIIVLPAPIANAGIDTAICAGDSTMLQASGGLTYSWQPSSDLTDAFISNPVAFPNTTTAYIVKVNDGGTCFGYDTVVITVNSLPDANAGEDQTVCAGDVVNLNASGGSEYLWSPSTSLSSSTISNPSATVTESITYTVTVTDLNHCSASDTIHLEVVPPLITTVSNDTSICLGSSSSLFADGGLTYNWSPSSTLNNADSPAPIASPAETTTYSVIISDGICNADTLSVTVFVSVPFIDAGTDATLLSGASYQFSVTASQGVYSWTPSENLDCTNCLNPVARPLVTTTYSVSVTDSLGCIATDEVTLSVGCNAEEIFIPNAFTPDKNGHNDVLLVRSTGVIDVIYFRIFDRWGKMIFESNDAAQGWDGTYKGQVLQPGVFLFTMQAKCGDGELIEKKGNVTLLK